MSIIPQREMRPSPDPTRDRCPGCADVICEELQLLAQRLAGVTRHPRLTLLCNGCQRTFLVLPPLTGKGAE
jgi:hypothetical protein